ncbi:hypothetical protein [Noviherbaspirillum cavernae]|uniref:hypothetical protein n=1 Tax=Noviherbaspirillum cavernae TaxID=2320862 RepID=UPI0030F37B74
MPSLSTMKPAGGRRSHRCIRTGARIATCGDGRAIAQFGMIPDDDRQHIAVVDLVCRRLAEQAADILADLLLAHFALHLHQLRRDLLEDRIAHVRVRAGLLR